jgi:Leucine-rich repeat (LRR) protein
MSNNLIYNLSSFNDLASLEHLVLSRNQVILAEGEALAGLKSLKTIDLSHNRIKLLPETLFQELVGLESINLGWNELKSFSLAKNRDVLKSLVLSSNQLDDTILGKLSQFSNLSELDLSSNRLSLMRKVYNFKFENLKTLILSNTNSYLVFAFLNCANVQHLDLSNNDLASINIEILKNFPKLKKIFLSSTNLNNYSMLNFFDGIVELDISDNRLQGINLDFILKDSIQSVKLSNNQILNQVNRYLIEKTIKNYKYFYLSNCNVRVFTKEIQQMIVNVEYLDISLNEIYSFTDETLLTKNSYNKHYFDLVDLRSVNLTKSLSPKLANNVYFFNRALENAYLSANELNNFPQFCKQNLNLKCNLAQLVLSSNKLAQIKFFDLMYLENLEHLDLSDNIISSVEANSFENLLNLETLSLHSNEIGRLSIQLFNGLSNLKHLNLSFNRIEFLDSYLFEELSKLEVIDLSNNLLAHIKENAFFDLVNLRDLHINNVNMSRSLSVDLNSFVGLDSIQNVYILKSDLLSERTKFIFKDLVRRKNEANVRFILSWKYYKSVNIITQDEYQDCYLTLLFIKYNIHFNLKKDISSFSNSCDGLYLPVNSSKEYFIKDFD